MSARVVTGPTPAPSRNVGRADTATPSKEHR